VMGNSGSFKKGNPAFNKGLKPEHYMGDESLKKMQETQFKKGIHTGEKSKSWKGGLHKPKADCIHVWTGTNQRVRQPKMVYEQHHGKISERWVIYHLDEDKSNDNIDNLIAIPRAILIKICAKRMNANYHEISQAVKYYLKSQQQNENI